MYVCSLEAIHIQVATERDPSLFMTTQNNCVLFIWRPWWQRNPHDLPVFLLWKCCLSCKIIIIPFRFSAVSHSLDALPSIPFFLPSFGACPPASVRFPPLCCLSDGFYGCWYKKWPMLCSNKKHLSLHHLIILLSENKRPNFSSSAIIPIRVIEVVAPNVTTYWIASLFSFTCIAVFYSNIVINIQFCVSRTQHCWALHNTVFNSKLKIFYVLVIHSQYTPVVFCMPQNEL